MDTMNFTFHIPTKLFFGPGCLNNLAETELPGKKALIVLSAGTSMKKFGYLDRVIDLLKKQGVESVIFDKILPNPVLRHVREGAETAKKEQCDFVLGLGGGSSIDSAKSIAVMVRNPGDYWDYVVGGSGKGKPVKEPVLPIVAVTTTAGTGTEADPWTVITKEDTNEKIGFGLTPQTFPTVSFVDPELMTSIPPQLTAYQGFDAFFHAAEGYIANIATPISDSCALKSIELLNTYLPRAVKDGNDIEARNYTALANTLSGMVESTSSCTSEHSLEHAMSAYHSELPHGAGLIMLSRSYFSFFGERVEGRLKQIAEAMGRKADDSGSGTEAFISALMNLQKACGVDTLKMSDFGITKEELPKLAENARDTMGGLFGMDRYALSFDETLKILSDAYA